jgi:hypothetical protein
MSAADSGDSAVVQVADSRTQGTDTQKDKHDTHKGGRKADPVRSHFTDVDPATDAERATVALCKRKPVKCNHCDKVYGPGNAKVENLRRHILQECLKAPLAVRSQLSFSLFLFSLLLEGSFPSLFHLQP